MGRENELWTLTFITNQCPITSTFAFSDTYTELLCKNTDISPEFKTLFVSRKNWINNNSGNLVCFENQYILYCAFCLHFKLFHFNSDFKTYCLTYFWSSSGRSASLRSMQNTSLFLHKNGSQCYKAEPNQGIHTTQTSFQLQPVQTRFYILWQAPNAEDGLSFHNRHSDTEYTTRHLLNLLSTSWIVDILTS